MVTLQIDAVKTDEGISLRPHADLVAGRGIHLVLDAGPSGTTNLFIARADGTGVTQVTNTPNVETVARWGP